MLNFFIANFQYLIAGVVLLSLLAPTRVRWLIWPIKKEEFKSFIPIAALMLCVVLNYTMLRTIKDSLIVNSIGAEAISYIKFILVLPAAMIFVGVYYKLVDNYGVQKSFYFVVGGFAVLFSIFAICFPYADTLQASKETLDVLSEKVGAARWIVKILGHWIYTLFYISAELWGSIVLSLLFWQFANSIFIQEQSRRLYPTMGMVSNFGSIATGFLIPYFMYQSIDTDPSIDTIVHPSSFQPLIIINAIVSVAMLFIYQYANNVLDIYKSVSNKKKSKVKPSLMEGVKLLFNSKYMLLIAVLVVTYGASINLVEGIWKHKMKLYTVTKEGYAIYMAQIMGKQGGVAILMMILGSNILPRITWKTGALTTPLIILVTGSIMFALAIGEGLLSSSSLGLSTLLAIMVFSGSVQNVLSKGVKYAFFDPTKEMLYKPIEPELRSKGKAAVDVVGGRLGKSAGALLQLGVFTIPGLSFEVSGILWFFGTLFIILCILWLYAVFALSVKYEALTNPDNPSKSEDKSSSAVSK